MFISVKEAIELTGKSQTTIYRLCKKRIRTDYIKVEGSQYLIDKDFLLETYPPPPEEEEKLLTIEDDNIDTKEPETEDKAKQLAKQIAKSAEEFENAEIENNGSVFEKLSYWETIIGLSVSTLLIVGFILMLYFNTKTL